jgi:hypothetical protein
MTLLTVADCAAYRLHTFEAHNSFSCLHVLYRQKPGAVPYLPHSRLLVEFEAHTSFADTYFDTCETFLCFLLWTDEEDNTAIRTELNRENWK